MNAYQSGWHLKQGAYVARGTLRCLLSPTYKENFYQIGGEKSHFPKC